MVKKGKRNPKSSCNEQEALERLLAWFSKNGRALPWRDTRDPYRVWVSEVILQQTQVSRGIEYYPRFLKSFPDIRSLAQARWPSVLKVWRGLGYYRRAENMKKAAAQLVEREGGVFPSEKDSLLELPGIGPYTASALRSFAFGKSDPAIDTNVSRILQRVHGCPSSQVEARAESLFRIKPRSGRKINYALMDLGALICRARGPRCEECPLQSLCHFRKAGLGEQVASRPVRTRKSLKPIVDVAIGCIHRDGHYLLGKRWKRMGGGWEFPGGKREGKESIRSALKREVQEEIGVEVSVRPAFLVHEFEDDTHLWRLHFCRCRILRGKERALEHEELKWVSKAKLQQVSMPSSNEDAVQYLASMRN